MSNGDQVPADGASDPATNNPAILYSGAPAPPRPPAAGDPAGFGIGPEDPRSVGCAVILGIFLAGMAVIAANAARTPSSDTQTALAGGNPVAAVASNTSQAIPSTPEPQSLSPLPALALMLGGVVVAPTAAPATAEPTPEPQTSTTSTTTQTTTTQTTHTTSTPTAPPHTQPPPPPPQTCVATTITVTQSNGATQTVSGSGDSVNRSFSFTMTGTTVTVHAADNPNCSPPHYKVAMSSTDGSFANNCGPPANSDTSSFKDGSPGELATVNITEVQSCS